VKEGVIRLNGDTRNSLGHGMTRLDELGEFTLISVNLISDFVRDWRGLGVR
jgi:hypothetical protein